ncbi:HNH endonuclease [Providencia rettgeri]|uniref:NUMOD4 domain-containing protein n=1 Tax=Providencia rettgeri TaxID=587 RepID=UPI0022207EBD|nr:NUMOD4 domain-containing protein [Providencia rettgeri]UYV42386.1 HNH endonuclease [Providencia rettgeri]
MIDETKDIPGYEGLYAITIDGRVYSHSRVVKASHGSTQLRKGRWLKQHENNKGYMYLPLTVNGVRKLWLVHRLVAITFVDNPDNKKIINHIDSNPKNNHALNLEWCTQSENMRHCVKSKRHKPSWVRGESQAASKLTEKDVISIRNSHGVTQRGLAKLYGVSQTVIHNVISGKSWSHING